MTKFPSLFRLRRTQQKDKQLLRGAQLIIAVVKPISRCMEMFGPFKKRQNRCRSREKMQAILREKMQAISRERDDVLKIIETHGPRAGMDALHEFRMRHSRPEDMAELNAECAKTLAGRQEIEDLKNIRTSAQGDTAIASQGFQDYIAAHPGLYSPHRWLASTLHKAGDLNDCIAEHRIVIEIAGDNCIPGAMSRIDIGSVLREQGHYAAALAEFRFVIEHATQRIEPIVCRAFFALGSTLSDMGDKKEARAAWKQAAQWDKTGFTAKQVQAKLQAHS